jgi:non-ribosomal peptide synthetase component F
MACTIWDLVDEQAGRTPWAAAAIGERVCPYQEFAERAAALSESISGHAPAGSLVAVDTDDPLSAALAFVAAGRSGCAVLPLNRQSPPAHRDRMLADALPSVLLGADAGGALSVTRTGLAPRPGQDTGRTGCPTAPCGSWAVSTTRSSCAVTGSNSARWSRCWRSIPR